MGLQAAMHLGHMPWALTKEEEEERVPPQIKSKPKDICEQGSY
jgi:hypothetical protein